MFKENEITVPFTQVVVSNRGNEGHEVSKAEKDEANKFIKNQNVNQEKKDK